VSGIQPLLRHGDPEPARSSPDVERPGGVQLPADPVVVIMLADIQPRWWPWGWQNIVRGAAPLAASPGLRLAKVMGSGAGGGFVLRPSPSHQGMVALFDSLTQAETFVATAPRVQALRERSREWVLMLLRPWSSRGSWDGQRIPVDAGISPPAGPVVALTRASIRPRQAGPFWKHAPAAQAGLAGAPGCRLAAGLGEAPLLRQCTVSLWDDVAAMDAYARAGAHQAAIRAAHAGGWFSESMFVRFTPLRVQGRWQGVGFE